MMKPAIDEVVDCEKLHTKNMLCANNEKSKYKGQGNSANSLQQVPLSSLQQNNVSTPQQTNINSLSSQAGVNVIQPNLNTHQSGSTMLQPQLKHQEYQMLQNQQYKQQYQQQGPLMQRQQIHTQRQRLHQSDFSHALKSPWIGSEYYKENHHGKFNRLSNVLLCMYTGS